jgi:hypothetical protein
VPLVLADGEVDEEPAVVLESAIDRLGAVHVSDIKRRGSFEPTAIGTGVSPIPQLLRRIVSSGFDGWVSVEEASQAGDEGIGRAIKYTDRAWVISGRPETCWQKTGKGTVGVRRDQRRSEPVAVPL